MNTNIEYMYMDASNYKRWMAVVVKGEISPEQIQTVMSCLEDGEFFVPEQVGLPADRFEEYGWDEDDDHPWFELGESDFSPTENPETVDITVDELVGKFISAKGKWECFCY